MAPLLDTDTLVYLGSFYGPQLVLLATLSAITVYRREMSCNHCYAEPQPVVEDDWDDEETEALLEEIGLYSKGAALLPRYWMSLVEHAERAMHKLLPPPNSDVEDFLDAAGRYYGFAGAVLPEIPQTPAVRRRHRRKRRKECAMNPLTALPTDAQVLILSFLPTKDVVILSGISRSNRDFIERGDTSTALWKTLWQRDYAWVVEAWSVGREALARSMPDGIKEDVYDKEFYFRFGLCYINYLLAGQNTYEQCLVGLAGHIYDLSLFLSSHPGSPETVLVHAGKDATDMFESVRHSLSARRLARSLCVVVEGDGGRLHPTKTTESVGSLPVTVEAPPMDVVLDRRRIATLEWLLEDYRREEAAARQAAQRFASMSPFGECNVYYDPFSRRWNAWYTDRNFDPAFVDEL